MQTEQVALTPGPMSGSRHLTVYRFGTPGARPRVYIQGGLHADEAPGMLVGFSLRDSLAKLEAEGRIKGEVLLVPLANPIGLDQGVVGGSFGRFEATSGQNFNRNFPDAAALALAADDRAPGNDPVAELRTRLAAGLDALQPRSPIGALQRALLRMAIDADIVLDMHCDSEAVTHIYCHAEQTEEAARLGHATGSGAVLHAEVQGGRSFDEACTLPWVALRERFQIDLPIACFAVTLEWRGVLDTCPDEARRDAEAVISWLAHTGCIEGPAGQSRGEGAAPTPLAAVEVVSAPAPGLFHACVEPGARVQAGTRLGTVKSFPDGQDIAIHASTEGVLYAREQMRIVRAGTDLFFVAGQKPLRQGMLLGA
ncbi:succinylglutamate desuccinylase/aspartoacylase family protein [Sedimentimonas flavescens]|uniref:succinylglutamate desuccinylase/aspartoacylase family protein n=1 Tax=Sedimentimonas flavescens TaxID=2851012 RepID=UPI0021A32138|nr:succinylglutamate desuccinylase/aspartoacylase family protein [Sedimentimonas flavescens]MCT2539663.1 M14 family metallopeptidase [Sedimentimonas flavescens]